MLCTLPRRYSPTELELIQARADAQRTSPHWAFAPLTPLQQRGVDDQVEAMQRRGTPLGVRS